MRKATKIVGFLAIAGTLMLTTAGFAGNVNRGDYSNNTMNNGRWMNNQATQNANMKDTCPWYKTWFGYHNDNCRWDTNTRRNNRKAMNNQATQNANMNDTCPWYKAWFGYHNNNCRWDTDNNNNNRGCCR